MSTNPRSLGKYELQERLGRGGMAEVWKALDTQLQRYVAIKFLHSGLHNDPDFVTRFIREAQTIASLRHPNIVQVHDFQTASSSDSGGIVAYMVMNYIEGPTLAEYIRTTSRIGKFPPTAEILHLFTTIGNAIDYAHRYGMVHRDIKPANILLNKKLPSRYQMGEPILTDFGIVKLLGATSGTINLDTITGVLSLGASGTLSGTLLGTPLYMAPEQARGQPGNECSDIYSLGVILYEICTGVVPFQGSNPSAIIMQHVFAVPSDPALINPNIPLALAEVILRCLAKDPAARFPNASSLSAAIAESLAMQPTPNLNSPTRFSDTPSKPISMGPSQLNPPSPQGLQLSSPTGSAASLDYVTKLDQPTAKTAYDKQSPSVTSAGNISSSADLEQSQPHMTTVHIPSGMLSALLSSTPPLTPAHPPGVARSATRNKLRSAMLVVVISLLLLVFVGAGLGTFYLLLHKNPGSTAGQIVGHVFFVSSGHLEESNSQGIEDEVQIDLQDIPDPAPGKDYFAWLLSNTAQNPIKAIALGRLTIDHGKVSVLHRHDQHYTNLLAVTGSFLITEENTKQIHTAPSTDQRTWRYYAQFSQTPSATVLRFSVLDYLRDLLYVYEGHFVPPQAIRNALAIQFLRNVYQVFVGAKSAKDNWDSKNAPAIHEQIVRILDYLDSASFVKQDVPSGTPVLVDPGLPLLDFSTEQTTAGYFSRLDEELQGIIDAPEVTPAMQMLANDTLAALPIVQNWLDKVHKDAASLVGLTNEQLLQDSAHSILDHMEMQANDAYAGQGNPANNQFQGGALWIITNKIAQLATLDVRRLLSEGGRE